MQHEAIEVVVHRQRKKTVQRPHQKGCTAQDGVQTIPLSP